jgi:predicted choloylglycine hydrolase
LLLEEAHRRYFMRHPTVRGTYYEMGYRYGKRRVRKGFKMPISDKDELAYASKSEPEIKRVFPEILQEIAGVADAFNTQYEQVAAMLFNIGAYKAKPECSILACLSGSDVLVGRNYDFFYSFKKYNESYLTCPEKGYWSIGHTNILIGRDDGINEKGLAIAMTGVQPRAKESPPGMTFVVAVRCVLDKCANVKEAIKVLSDIKHISANNFLVADREGNMAVVEASSEKVRTRRPQKGESFLVCTNHFVHPEMQDVENLSARSTSEWDSLPRYEKISNVLAEFTDATNVALIEDVLSDHSGYVCSHQEKIKLGTLWSIIISLKELQLFRAEGHPCKSKFRQDQRLINALNKRKMQ